MQNSSKKIKILTVSFDFPIQYEELPLLRGAVIQLSQFKSDLFHNHTNEGVIYRYPLIQYKKIRKKAALFCLEEGTQVVSHVFDTGNLQIVLGNKPVTLIVEDIHAFPFLVEAGEATCHYRLENWLPLNQENYQRYHSCATFQEKAQVLENVLKGNLLTFCKGIGMHPDAEIRAVIERIAKEKIVKYRGQIMQAYDIDFSANISIPDYVGLGKGSGIGYGMVIAKRK